MYLTRNFYYRFGLRRKEGAIRLIFERKLDDIHMFSGYETVERDAIQIGIVASKKKFDYVVDNMGKYDLVLSASTRFCAAK